MYVFRSSHVETIELIIVKSGLGHRYTEISIGFMQTADAD